jgi:hypothetical protein
MGGSVATVPLPDRFKTDAKCLKTKEKNQSMGLTSAFDIAKSRG